MIIVREKFIFEIISENSICIITGKGQITFEETVNAMNFIAFHPDFDPDFNVIVDLRLINYHPSYKDLQGIISAMKVLKDRFKNKVAIITDYKLDVIAKLFVIYNKQAGIKIRSFTNREKADLWIS